jgi:hypothetical protein
MTKYVSLIQTRANIPIQINSQIMKAIICEVWGSFAIWSSSPTSHHHPNGFTPTSTCPTKHSDGRCLGFVAFECHANFHINWRLFAHRDQPKIKIKTCLGYVALKTTEVTNVNFWFVNRFHYKSVTSTFPNIEVIQNSLLSWIKIIHMVEHRTLEHEQE